MRTPDVRRCAASLACANRLRRLRHRPGPRRAARLRCASPTPGLRVLGVDKDPDRLAALRDGRMPFAEPGADALLAQRRRSPRAERPRGRRCRRAIDRPDRRHADLLAHRDRHGRDPLGARRPAAAALGRASCSSCARPSRPAPRSSAPATWRSTAASPSARTSSSPTSPSASPPRSSSRRSRRCRASSAASAPARAPGPPSCSPRSARRSSRPRRCRPSWRRSGPTSCATRRSRCPTC